MAVATFVIELPSETADKNICLGSTLVRQSEEESLLRQRPKRADSRVSSSQA